MRSASRLSGIVFMAAALWVAVPSLGAAQQFSLTTSGTIWCGVDALSPPIPEVGRILLKLKGKGKGLLLEVTDFPTNPGQPDDTLAFTVTDTVDLFGFGIGAILTFTGNIGTKQFNTNQYQFGAQVVDLSTLGGPLPDDDFLAVTGTVKLKGGSIVSVRIQRLIANLNDSPVSADGFNLNCPQLDGKGKAK